MATVNGESGFSQLDRLNVRDQLLLRGFPVDIAARSVVVVNELGDFPDPVSGVITLDDGQAYEIGDNVDIGTNCIQVGQNNSIFAHNLGKPTITYTGTGEMFKGGDFNQLLISKISLDAPNGDFFNFSDTASPGSSTFVISQVNFNNCKKFATLDNLRTVLITDSGVLGNADDGFTLTGANWTAFSIERFGVLTTSNTFVGIDFTTSVHLILEIENMPMLSTVSGAIGFKGLPNSGNVQSGRIAYISSCEFFGGMTPLDTISDNDTRFSFLANDGIRDSQIVGETFLDVTRLVTITAIGVFVEVGGTDWTDGGSRQFSSSSDGILTFLPERSRSVFITASVTLGKVTGGSDELCAVIAIDTGSGFVMQAKSETCTSSQDPTAVTCQGLFELNEGDKIQVFVANRSTTGNINVDLANLIVR